MVVRTPTPYVEIRTTRRGVEKAYLVGTRTSVLTIYVQHELRGQSPEEIVAALPHLTLSQVHGALAYLYEHRDEIVQQWKQECELVQRLRDEIGKGPLAAKLNRSVSCP